jgi:hypothetical protein
MWRFTVFVTECTVICRVYINSELAINLFTTVLDCDIVGSVHRRRSLLLLCIGIYD